MNHRPYDETHPMHRVSIPTAHLPGFQTTIADKQGNLQRIMMRTWGGLGDQICAEPTIRYALRKFKDCEFFLASEFPELFQHLHPQFKFIYNINEDEINYEKYFLFDMIKPPNDTNLVWQFMSHLLTNCVDFPSLCAFRLQLPVEDKVIRLTGKVPSLSFEEMKHVMNGILVHPGAHWQIKRFPTSFWNSVLNRIRFAGKVPVLIGGTLDDNRTTIKDVNTSGCLDLRDKMTVQESIWACQNAAVLLTNDSAPMHMAASGKAFVGFIATCKHPDMIMHWRDPLAGVSTTPGNPVWAWREKNHGKGGIWDHIDYCPNKKNQLEVEDVPDELRDSWLPDPMEYALWALVKQNEYIKI